MIFKNKVLAKYSVVSAEPERAYEHPKEDQDDDDPVLSVVPSASSKVPNRKSKSLNSRPEGEAPPTGRNAPC